MRFREPLYLSDTAAGWEHEYCHMLECPEIFTDKELSFYLIVNASNDCNLMEIIQAFQLVRQIPYRKGEIYVAGIASDADEACELCRRIVSDCYEQTGSVSRGCFHAYCFNNS